MTKRPISADSHVTEPPNCFIDHIEPAFRDRAPRLTRDPQRGDIYVVPGMTSTIPNLVRISKEAAGHVVRLGLRPESEAMLQHAEQAVPDLKSVSSRLDVPADGGEPVVLIVAETAAPDRGGMADVSAELDWDRWAIATFGPEVRFQKAPPPGQANLPPSAGLQFFGEVTISAKDKAMTVNLRDLTGTILFSQVIPPEPA